MKLAFAIHQIILSATNIVDPGSVFLTNNFGELEHLGAVREPTKEENALYQMTAQQNARADAEPAYTRADSPAVQTARAELEARAVKAGVDFKANIGDAKLLERVIEAEAKMDSGDDKDVKDMLV